jgi:hypothetical protein
LYLLNSVTGDVCLRNRFTRCFDVVHELGGHRDVQADILLEGICDLFFLWTGYLHGEALAPKDAGAGLVSVDG